MEERTSDRGPTLAGVEEARQALIDAAIRAYEDAGMSGLCAEGRWEAAVSALRTLDLGEHAAPRGDTGARE